VPGEFQISFHAEIVGHKVKFWQEIMGDVAGRVVIFYQRDQSHLDSKIQKNKD